MRVVSGGQTGVDRAGLDAALEAGVPIGGWCPRGRLAEDGSVPERYPLREGPSPGYLERTEWNARDSDGTLILNVGPLTTGSLYTEKMAKRHQRPCMVLQLEKTRDGEEAITAGLEDVRRWMRQHKIRVLNVAGPRETKTPGIYAEARAFLTSLFKSLYEQEDHA